MCVADQVLATGTLCCVETGNLCYIGWADEKLSGNSYSRWRKNRYGILKRWINDGTDVVVQLMGQSLQLIIIRPQFQRRELLRSITNEAP